MWISSRGQEPQAPGKGFNLHMIFMIDTEKSFYLRQFEFIFIFMSKRVTAERLQYCGGLTGLPDTNTRFPCLSWLPYQIEPNQSGQQPPLCHG